MKVVFNNSKSSYGAFQNSKSGTAFPSNFNSASNNLQNNNSLTFKGVNPQKITQKATGLIDSVRNSFANGFMKEVGTIPEFSKLINSANEQIGQDFVPKRVAQFYELYGTKASKYLQLDEDVLRIYDKNWFGKLLDGLVDVAKLPIDILCSFSGLLNKMPLIKNAQFAKDLQKSSIVQNRVNEKAGADLFYHIKGLLTYQDVSKLKRDIYKIPEGKPVGNYATKSERALNRLATGAISSIFVGMDFHNLALYEHNDKEKAKEVGRKRRNREFTRFTINAFTTYSVLGAFQKANTDKIFACALIAGSALFSEIVTRLASGTPLVPLTPERAKKISQKRGKKKTNTNDTPKPLTSQTSTPKPLTSQPLTPQPLTSQPSTQPYSTAQNQSSSFKAATPLNNVFAPFTNIGLENASQNNLNNNSQNVANTNDTSSPNKKENKKLFFHGTEANELNKAEKPAKKSSPLTMKKVGMFFAFAFAFDLLLAVARSKSTTVNKAVNRINDFGNHLYDKVAKTKLEVDQKDLKHFLTGFDGSQLEGIKSGYSRLLTNVEFTPEQIAILSRGAQNGRVTINMESLTDDKTKVFKDAFIRTAETQADERLLKILETKPDMDFMQARQKIHEAIERSTTLRRVGKNKYVSNLNVKNISFEIAQKTGANGTQGSVYVMENAKYDFGNIKDTKFKGLADAASYFVKSIKSIINFPMKPLEILAGKSPEQIRKEKLQSKFEEARIVYPNLGELYKDCSVMFKRFRKGEVTEREFKDYIASANTKVMNKDTTPTYPQTSLASLSRNFVTLISSYFFINDFRNEVLIQSAGENTEKASEVTKERTAHKVANYVTNKCFMELFNNTFQKQYLGSLLGASVVAAATEVTNESFVRASIGVPVVPMKSKEAIDKHEQKHLEAKGAAGAYYRFMARLTGKKMLSEKAENKKGA